MRAPSPRGQLATHVSVPRPPGQTCLAGCAPPRTAARPAAVRAPAAASPASPPRFARHRPAAVHRREQAREEARTARSAPALGARASRSADRVAHCMRSSGASDVATCSRATARLQWSARLRRRRCGLRLREPGYASATSPPGAGLRRTALGWRLPRTRGSQSGADVRLHRRGLASRVRDRVLRFRLRIALVHAARFEDERAGARMRRPDRALLRFGRPRTRTAARNARSRVPSEPQEEARPARDRAARSSGSGDDAAAASTRASRRSHAEAPRRRCRARRGEPRPFGRLAFGLGPSSAIRRSESDGGRGRRALRGSAST